MKKIFLIFTILIFAARFGFSQTSAGTEAVKDDKKAPVITFENNGLHDFGSNRVKSKCNKAIGSFSQRISK